jgi:hypothetical protein
MVTVLYRKVSTESDWMHPTPVWTNLKLW